MARLKDHQKISRELLGSDNILVHKILDHQSSTLEHRFRHTPKTVDQISDLLGEENRVIAWLHLLTDWHLFDGEMGRQKKMYDKCKKKVYGKKQKKGSESIELF